MMREPELKPKMPQKRPLDILFVEDNTADVDLSLRAIPTRKILFAAQNEILLTRSPQSCTQLHVINPM